jgi:YfiH family protein
MGSLMPSTAIASVSGLPWQGVKYFCTTRQGGVSGESWASLNVGLHTGDDHADVIANRQLLRAGLPGDPVWLNQVHGAKVFDADQLAPIASEGVVVPPDADAAVTTQQNRVLAIMTADCLPVVLASNDGRALGLAHAGWRGLAAGVLEQTMLALRDRSPESAGWRAWIGPAIGQPHFEVGADVYEAFVGQDEQTAAFFAQKIPGQKWLADLPALARHRLYKAGVDSIELSGHCTFSRPDLFYSYRRQARTGRLVTVAWLADEAAVLHRGKQRSDLP